MAYGSHSSKKQSFLNRNWGQGVGPEIVVVKLDLKTKNLEEARKGSRNNNRREKLSIQSRKSETNLTNF